MAGIDFIANSIMSNRLNGRPDGTPNMMAVSLEAGLLGRMKAEDSGATAEDIATVEGMISTLRKYGTSLHMPGELSATEISQKVRAIKQRMETGS